MMSRLLRPSAAAAQEGSSWRLSAFAAGRTDKVVTCSCRSLQAPGAKGFRGFCRPTPFRVYRAEGLGFT